MSAARQGLISQLETQILTADQLLAIQQGKAIPSTIPGTVEEVEGQLQQQKEAKRQEEKRQKTIAAELKRQAQVQAQQAKQLGEATKQAFKRVTFSVEKVRMPGGIGVPLTILLLLLIVLIPVNGHTRITWLWFALIKHAKFVDTLSPTPSGTPAPPPVPGGNVPPGGTGFPPVTPPTPTPTPAPPGFGPATTSGILTMVTNYADIMARVDN